MVEAIIYSDGGKNKKKGAYGSFKVFVEDELKRTKLFNFENGHTAPDAEVHTLQEVILYIKEINSEVYRINTNEPWRNEKVSWRVNIDAEWLYGHLTTQGRKIAQKHRKAIDWLLNNINELDITLIQVSGDEMKAKLGH